MSENPKNEPAPGDGIRSLKTSKIFRVVNFELYTKPVSVEISKFWTILSKQVTFNTYRPTSPGFIGVQF